LPPPYSSCCSTPPPTTSTYTLSLHDALPIFLLVSKVILHDGVQSVIKVVGTHTHFTDIRSNYNSGLCRRCGAGIGHKIADAEVHFVTYGADCWQFAVIEGSCHRLLIKRPKILQRTSAASYYEYIYILMVRKPIDAFYNLWSGIDALYAGMAQQYLGCRPAALQRIANVVECRTGC